MTREKRSARQDPPPSERKQRHQDFVNRFVFSDCKVVQCHDGHIYFQDRGYEVIARCPGCDRSPYKWIPIYQGKVEQHTDAEMAARITRRREVAADPKERYDRAKEIIRGIYTMLVQAEKRSIRIAESTTKKRGEVPF